MKLKNLSHTWTLAAICIATHALAIPLFGAVFWIDSIHYANLGISLLGQDSLAMYYDGIGTWLFSHLQPGLPIVGIFLAALPTDTQWPVLALSQHALAAYACYLFFSTIDRFWPSWWNMLGCLLISLLPFYQAAHGSFMTESLNSSLILMGLSLAICITKDNVFRSRQFVLLLCIVLLITQLRSYSGGLVAGMAFLALFRHKLVFSRHSLACAITVVVAATAFPLYRYAATGVFWLPSAGLNSLMAGWWVNPKPSASTLRILDTNPAPPQFEPEKLVNKGLSYEDAIGLAQYWRASGLSNQNINARAQDMGKALRSDGWEVHLNRVALGLTSSGMVLPYCLIPSATLVFPRLSASQMCAHQFGNYKFQSWVNSGNHDSMFQTFFETPSAMDSFAALPLAKLTLSRAMRRFLIDSPAWAKDPLFLGRAVPPDLWVVAGILALVLLARRERYLAMMCGWLVFSNFFVSYSFPLGNARYGYALFPVYIGLCCVAISTSDRMLRRNSKSA